jgi:hypothetical protein
MQIASNTVSAIPEPSAEPSGSTAEAAAPQPDPTPTLPEHTTTPEPTPIPSAPNPVVAVPQDEEPQNPLTEKFTKAEWDALKEFRVSWSRQVLFMLS